MERYSKEKQTIRLISDEGVSLIKRNIYLKDRSKETDCTWVQHFARYNNKMMLLTETSSSNTNKTWEYDLTL